MGDLLAKGEQFLDDVIRYSSRNDLPAIVNGGMFIPERKQESFRRIRDHFRTDYREEYYGSLDEFILSRDTRKSRDYRQRISEYFERLLRFYNRLHEHVVLVPGPYDVLPEDIRVFQERHHLNLPSNLLREEHLSLTFCDCQEIHDFFGKSILGVGGATSFDDDLPALIQHGRFRRLKRTNPERIRSLFENGMDYLITGIGLEGSYDGTYEENRWKGEGLSVPDEMKVHRLILDRCKCSRDIHSPVSETDGMPILHGKIEQAEKGFFVVSEKSDGYRIDVKYLQDGEVVRRYLNQDGEWHKPTEEDRTSEEEKLTPKTSVQEYTKGIRKGKEMAKVYNNRGIARRMKGDLDGALSDYRKALECKPNYAPAYNNLGLVHRKQGEVQKAIANYTKALKLDPEYDKAYANRGAAFLKYDQLGRALRDYNRAIELSPRDDELYVNRGLVHRKMEKYEKALRDLDKAVQINRQNARAHFQKGLTQMARKEYQKALKSFTRTVELDSEMESAHFYRGKLYRAMNQWEKALVSFSKAIKHGYSSEHIYWERAEVLEMLNYDKEAISDWTSYLEQNGGRPEGRARRGFLYRKQGEDKKARKDLENFLKESPSDHVLRPKARRALQELQSSRVPQSARS